MQTFEDMELDRSLVEALKITDITVPTEIQQKVIPEARKSKDLIFQSETGTGKTLAYLLPLFEKIETDKKEMQAIILVPTHELAIQVIRQIELLSLNSELKVTSTPVIGDVNITRQVDKLRTKPHIIVGTAGRILELIQKKKITAHTVKTIIIDEADRLLDDNNIDGTKAVIKTTLKERQLMMCSASMSARTIERAKQLMKEPEVVKSTTAIEVPDTIDHIYFVAERRDKIEVLRKLVRMLNPPKAIAFFANAEDIAEATEKLQFHKLRADGLHGSNIKSDRKKTMDDFKSGKLQLLIASDIAARGLDIEGVTHIFNVNVPERSMDYLHRAGRTGRNGNAGVAISIAAENEIPFIRQFEKELKISIIPKSMYNGAIVEYRKTSKKLDTTSEYGLHPRKRNMEGPDPEKPSKARYGKDGDKSSQKYEKDETRTPKKYGKDENRTPRKYGEDEARPPKKFKKDGKAGARPETGRSNYGRGGDRYEKAGAPSERKYKKPSGEFRFKDGKAPAKNRAADGKPVRDDARRSGVKPDRTVGGKSAGKPLGAGGRPDKAFGGKPSGGKTGGKPERSAYGKADKASGGKPERSAYGKFDKTGGKPERSAGGRPGKTQGQRTKSGAPGKGKAAANGKPWERKPQAGKKPRGK